MSHIARAMYADDRAAEGLPSALIATEHITCHGRRLTALGSTYAGDVATHRFGCENRNCPLRVTFEVVGKATA